MIKFHSVKIKGNHEEFHEKFKMVFSSTYHKIQKTTIQPGIPMFKHWMASFFLSVTDSQILINQNIPAIHPTCFSHICLIDMQNGQM